MNSVLDKFEVFGSNPDTPFVSVTEHGISFSKKSIELIGYPAYVKLYLNRAERQFAIQPCENDPAEQGFFKTGKDKARPFVRWNNKNVIGPILDMLPENATKEGIRVNGVYYKEENCIIFDCTKVDKLSRGRRK